MRRLFASLFSIYFLFFSILTSFAQEEDTWEKNLRNQLIPIIVETNSETPVYSIYQQLSMGTRRNIFKGNVAEDIMHKLYEKEGYIRLPINPLGSHHQGIDGLYIKYDQAGRPRSLLVSESKYGSSQLINTNDGKQMGREWVRSRLQGAADMLKSFTVESKFLAAAADGKILYKSRLHRLDINEAEEISIKVTELDKNKVTEVYRGLLKGAPTTIQKETLKAIEDNFYRQKIAQGLKAEEARTTAKTLVKELYQNNRISKLFRETVTAHKLLEIGNNVGESTLYGGVYVGAFDLAFQFVNNGFSFQSVDWGQFRQNVFLGSVSAGGGTLLREMVALGYRDIPLLGPGGGAVLFNLLNFYLTGDKSALVKGFIEIGVSFGVAEIASVLGAGSAAGPLGVAAGIGYGLRDSYLQNFQRSLIYCRNAATSDAVLAGLALYFFTRETTPATLFALQSTNFLFKSLQAAEAWHNEYIFGQQNPILRTLFLEKLPEPSQTLKTLGNAFDTVNSVYLSLVSLSDIYDMAKNPQKMSYVRLLSDSFFLTKGMLFLVTEANAYYVATFLQPAGVWGYFSYYVLGVKGTTALSGPLATLSATLAKLQPYVLLAMGIYMAYNFWKIHEEQGVFIKKQENEIEWLKKKLANEK